MNYLNGKNDGYKRSLLVRQKDKDGNIIGGHAFIINPIEFHVIEVTIEEAETASGITLTATGVSEEADYVWADSSGEVIATGETAVVPVSGTTESYIVQVTAKDDGLRAYARTDVTSDPLALSPNPATSHINVSFSLPTGSYTLCVYDGTTMQLAQSQSVSGGEQTISLDVSSMAAGVHVVNIIDATGAIVRTGKFIKN